MADEARSFRFKPIDVEIGPADAEGKRQKISIKDLSYVEHKAFIAKICKLIAERSTLPTVIEALPKAIEREIAIKNVSTKDAIDNFLKQIVEIYSELNSGQVFELLKIAVGDNQLKEEDFNKMGASEALGLLTFLIQLRCEPLKNFNASLNDTLFQKTK
jgi:hypothetical protein